MHQQQQSGRPFAEDNDDLQEQQLRQATDAALVQALQEQLAEEQKYSQLLQQQLVQQLNESESLRQQVEQLQAFAQQQEEKLAYSEEIISRMQSLAGRLATIR
jgi:hypothetical protein